VSVCNSRDGAEGLVTMQSDSMILALSDCTGAPGLGMSCPDSEDTGDVFKRAQVMHA
jgi:hypothetical protein